MSANSSPKVVKVDLHTQLFSKKARRKIEGPSKKSLFLNKFSQAIKKDKVPSQSDELQRSKQSLFESKVQPYEANQFSFSESSHSYINKIRGIGYQIFVSQKHAKGEQKQQSISLIHVNMALKIFQLCGKNYEKQNINLTDLEYFSKNVLRELKQIYGERNEQLISKKELQLRQHLKVVFYRKRQFDISELLSYIFDCGVADEILSKSLQLFPYQKKQS